MLPPNPYIEGLQDTAPKWQRDAAQRMLAAFDDGKVRVTDGIARWTVNGAVPPGEILQLWGHTGKPFDIRLSNATREAEIAEFLARRGAHQPAEPSNEERASARAAHGPGADLVDVTTGRKLRT